MQEAAHIRGLGELRQPLGAVRVDRKHRGAVLGPKRHERRQVYDPIDAAQAFGERGFVFEACFDPFVVDVGKLRQVLAGANQQS